MSSWPSDVVLRLLLWILANSRIVSAGGHQPTSKSPRVRGKPLSKNQRYHVDNNNKDDVFVQHEAAANQQQLQQVYRFVIEGVSLAEAQCPECLDDLHAEQDHIWEHLVTQYGKSHVMLVYRDDFLINVQFVDIAVDKQVDDTDDDDDRIRHAMERFLYSIPGVRQVSLSRDDLQLQIQPQGIPMRTPTVMDVAHDYVQGDGNIVQREFCVSGTGVRVAVLDTGLDYTHAVFGGEGTADAYVAAYGLEPSSQENTLRDGFFPTARVVEGWDFVGEGDASSSVTNIKVDEDPVDSPGGHGTRVASCVLAVAPDVELIAVKVCSSTGCPEFSVLQGLGFAVKHGAHVINCKS